MLKYILKRMLQMIPTVLGVILLTFILFNIVGGDLASIALGKKVSLQTLENFDNQRGLNKPLFWGTRSKTRAYEDQDFSKGAGRWRGWSNAVYSAESGLIGVKPHSEINPLAFPLESDDEFVWTIRYRGNGVLANEELSSTEWKKTSIRFKGSDNGGFKTANQSLEIQSLQLRKVMQNPFDSQLLFYIRQLIRGDLGQSESLKQPVSKLLKDGL
ncbi:MAG TPA: hypothetical protein VIR63_04975, partial [Pontiella sp.]